MIKKTHAEILSERHSTDEMSSVERFPFVLILNNIRSMHNVGSIFRTSDAACLKKIYITGYTAQPPRDEIEKTALGATETVPWEYNKNVHDVIKTLKEKNYTIIALEQTHSSISVFETTLPKGDIALILGNEVFGIDDDVVEACDFAVDIPMYGMKHSLNVSVATGIAVFELIKQMSRV